MVLAPFTGTHWYALRHGLLLMNSVLSRHTKYVVIVGYCVHIVITLTNTCTDIGAYAFIGVLIVVCHRMRCALVGGVGQPCVTSAHFSHCACSGLWLLATDHDNSGSLSTTLGIRLRHLPMVPFNTEHCAHISWKQIRLHEKLVGCLLSERDSLVVKPDS